MTCPSSGSACAPRWPNSPTSSSGVSSRPTVTPPGGASPSATAFPRDPPPTPGSLRSGARRPPRSRAVGGAGGHDRARRRGLLRRRPLAAGLGAAPGAPAARRRVGRHRRLDAGAARAAGSVRRVACGWATSPIASLLGLTLGTLVGKLLVLRLVALLGAFAVWWQSRRRSAGARPLGRRGAGAAGRRVVQLLGAPGAGAARAGDRHGRRRPPAGGSRLIGGLVVLVTGVLPVAAASWQSDDVPAVLRRWSRVAMAAVAVLVVTGTVQAWRGVGAWAAMTTTTYGRLVLVKVGLLVVVLVGAEHEPASRGRARARRVDRAGPGGRAGSGDRAGHVGGSSCGAGRPRGASAGSDAAAASAPPPALGRLRLSVAVEACLLVVVLGVTAALVATVPGWQASPPRTRPRRPPATRRATWCRCASSSTRCGSATRRSASTRPAPTGHAAARGSLGVADAAGGSAWGPSWRRAAPREPAAPRCSSPCPIRAGGRSSSGCR